MFSLGGNQVAGVGPLLNDTQPPGWCTYIASQNVEVTTATASAAGARVLIPPFDVPGSGRVAVVVDPTGADVWFWQPAGFSGAQVIGEPGAMCWNELGARDIDTAKAFYASAFDWRTATIPCQGKDCLAWVLDGKVIGGLVEINNEGESTTTAATWLVSFAVDDLYAAAPRPKNWVAGLMWPPAGVHI
jgi:predicted enzyme related to lactoylglutathione lyase